MIGRSASVMLRRRIRAPFLSLIADGGKVVMDATGTRDGRRT
jgi:hypothetical protein